MFYPENDRSDAAVLEPQQVQAFLDLIEGFGRVKLGMKDMVPRWSTEMRAQLQAVGMDVPADTEQIGLLRQFHRIFKILGSMPGGCSMGEISEQLGVSFSHATRVIEQMVQRRLLERHSSADDRRIILIRATPSGEQAYHIFDEAFRQRLGQLLGQFTAEEREQLLRLGHRLFEVLNSAIKVYGEAG